MRKALLLLLLTGCPAVISDLDAGSSRGGAGGGTTATGGGATATGGGAATGGGTATGGGASTGGGSATGGGGSPPLDAGTIWPDAGVFDGGFPFAIPNPGGAVLIGTNRARDIVPSPLSTGDWEYALFDCYGGGTYVADFSAGGAYVLASTGGHRCPPNFGAALFDFVDATWKRIDNANGMPHRVDDLEVSEVNGEDEIALSGVTPNAMPAPTHTYQNVAPIPTAQGGGSRGSVATVIGLFSTVMARGTSRAHRFDLDTGVWSRLSTNLAAHGGFTSLWEPSQQRYWVFPNELHAFGDLAYLDATDWTFKTVSLGNYPATDGANDTSFFEPTSRLLIVQTSTGHLRAMRVDAPAMNFTQLTVMGTLPNACRANRWERDPASGNFYCYPGSGQTLHKLTVPSNALTGTWEVGAITISGVTMPGDPDSGNGSTHYTRFFYVPPLQCFAWIGNANSQVVLLNPP